MYDYRPRVADAGAKRVGVAPAAEKWFQCFQASSNASRWDVCRKL